VDNFFERKVIFGSVPLPKSDILCSYVLFEASGNTLGLKVASLQESA